MGPAPHSLSLSTRPLVDQVNTRFWLKPKYIWYFCQQVFMLFFNTSLFIHSTGPDKNISWVLKSFLPRSPGAEEEAGTAETNPPGKFQKMKFLHLTQLSSGAQATSQMLRRPSHFTRAAHQDMSRPVLQVISLAPRSIWFKEVHLQIYKFAWSTNI